MTEDTSKAIAVLGMANAREAEGMDPQHGLFLECSWEALESAGYDPFAYPGRIGLYVGQSAGTMGDSLATWVANKLNLRGPVMTVRTTCSTSLTAIHLACRSLLRGECEMALAGGVAIQVPREAGCHYREGGARTVGVVVLRRLEDALAEGDRVLGVVRGTTLNDDGSAKVGNTASSVSGRSAVISDALAVAGVSADSIDFASRSWQLLLVSGRSRADVDASSQRLAAALRDGVDLADAAFTLHVGRRRFPHRRAIVCRDRDQAVAALTGDDPGRVLADHQWDEGDRGVVFLFPGGGAQYRGMGRGLYDTESVFREEIDRCARLAEPGLGADLRTVLYGEDENPMLEQIWLGLPALFAVEYAMARLWMSWGIRPAAMIGHSFGEYVVACLAGVLSLEDALSLAIVRGRLMHRTDPGEMVAVSLGEAAAREFCDDGLEIAAVNAHDASVIAGRPQAVAALRIRLDAATIRHTTISTDNAYHSSLMTPALEPFGAAVRSVRLSAPALPYVSCSTGRWITAEEAVDPGYWVRHLRETVRFSDAVDRVLAEPGVVLLEVGPGRTLSSLVSRWGPGATVATSMRTRDADEEDVETLLRALGRLWVSGVDADWPSFYRGEHRLRVGAGYERVGAGSSATGRELGFPAR